MSEELKAVEPSESLGGAGDGSLVPDSGSPKQPARSITRILLDSVERFGLLGILVLLVLVFGVLPKSSSVFLTSENINNILADQVVTGVIALAMLAPLVCGRFDLSVPATVAVVNVIVADMMGTHGMAVPLAILIGLGVGLVLGALTGFLVAGLKLNAFIVTLGLYTLLQGGAEAYTDGQTISGVPSSFGAWASLNWLGVPRLFIILVALALILWVLLGRTPFGRYLAAIGSNESAGRLVGIKVDRTIWISFLVSGTLAGIAGVLLTARTGGGSSSVGPTYLFPALAAVFLGATAIRPGYYNVWGTMIGVYVVAVAVSGLILLGAKFWVQPVFDGATLVLAVALSTFSGRARKRHEVAAQRRQARHRDPHEQHQEAVG